MKITPVQYFGDCRTGELVNTSVMSISETLGFEPNLKDDPYKVKHAWGFQVDFTSLEQNEHDLPDRVFIQIWDYKGSETIGQFSTYGDRKVLKHIFGSKYKSDR
jgi:hypothetical protein